MQLRGNLFVITLVCALASGANVASEEKKRATEVDVLSFEMGTGSETTSPYLYVPPSSVKRERADFVDALSQRRRDRRQLYEEYIDVIGANGILDGIEKLWPKCHSQAHDLGKVIFSRLQDIGLGLRTCADRCYSGCMHGVLMEAFTRLQKTDHDHINLSELRSTMKQICYKNEQMTARYRPGDCAHGVGHALMFLAKYKIRSALDACGRFDDPAMRYYCYTGAYMEYVTERHHLEKSTSSLFYPCDTYPYPTACARYKVPYVMLDFYRQGKMLDELIVRCSEFTGQVRHGCFHGLGNAHVYFISNDLMKIEDVCRYGTREEKILCIDGVMERMGKYRPKKALQVCEELDGEWRPICLAAAKRKMYHVDKDLTLYLKE